MYFGLQKKYRISESEEHFIGCMAIPKCRDKVGVCSEVIEDEIAHTIRNCNPLAAFLQRREPVEKRVVRTHGAFHGDPQQAAGEGRFVGAEPPPAYPVGLFGGDGRIGRNELPAPVIGFPEYRTYRFGRV